MSWIAGGGCGLSRGAPIGHPGLLPLAIEYKLGSYLSYIIPMTSLRLSFSVRPPGANLLSWVDRWDRWEPRFLEGLARSLAALSRRAATAATPVCARQQENASHIYEFARNSFA